MSGEMTLYMTCVSIDLTLITFCGPLAPMALYRFGTQIMASVLNQFMRLKRTIKRSIRANGQQ